MLKAGHSYKIKPVYQSVFKHTIFWRKHDVDSVVKVSFVLQGNAYFHDDFGNYLIASGHEFHCFEEVFTQETALKYVFENALNLKVEQEWCSKIKRMLVRYQVYSPYCSATSDWGVDMAEQLVQAVTWYDKRLGETE